jgi:MFS family permease
MKDNKIKYLVLFTVFIDITGLGIVIPVLPFYVERFSGSPFTVTTLFAVFALCSFISSPWIGALSDRFGRKPALMASIASTAAGWFIFAAAPTLWLLYLGRIVDGLAAGNLPVAQSALVDLAKDDRERTANLGLIGAVFGIGFIIGPFIGGALGHISYTLPFWFVGSLATLNFILAFFFLPETRTITSNHHDRTLSLNPIAPIGRAVRNAALRPNYIALFLFGLAVAGSQSVFSLYLNHVYGYEELAAGIIFALMGGVIAINQIFVMRKFWLKKFKEPVLELLMLLVFAFGYLMLSLPQFIFLVFGILAITFGQSVLRVVMNGQLIAKSEPERRGEVLGISTSIVSLAAGVSPFAAGALFTWRVYAPFLLGATLLLIAFAVLYRERKCLACDLEAETPVISEM